MLREAVDLARTYRLQRVLTDAHPALGAWLDQITRTGDGPEVAGSTVVLVRPSPRETSRPQTAEHCPYPKAPGARALGAQPFQ